MQVSNIMNRNTPNRIYTLSKCSATCPSAPMPFFFQVLVVFITLLGGVNSYAQDKSNEIDKIFNWATVETPGCACAVSQNGKVVYNKGFGAADLERNVAISTNSVFDAASVVKQFVAASTLLLVEEGKLSLTEDIHKYIPELPDYGKKITLDHLLTHTSGIRDWTGIMSLTAGNEDALTLILRQKGLNFAPGDEFSYSNSGYVLLKEIVARTSGMSFDDFTHKRLFEPLGMQHTAYRTDMKVIVKDRALAYDKGSKGWSMSMKLDKDRGGGGGLLSTPSDLLIWNDALTNNRLGSFVTQKLQEPAILNQGRKLGYARGLFLDTFRGTKEVWHSGGAAGYSTWLGRFSEQGLSIALMCNTDAMGTSNMAHRIASLYLPATTTSTADNTIPPIAADGVDTAILNLNSRTGLYWSETTGEPLRLVVDHGRLRFDDGPALVAQAKDHFKRWGTSLQYMSGDEFTVNFLFPDQFELKSMDGKTTRYRRAKPYAHTIEELKAFAGRYSSDEIGIVFQIRSKGDGLLATIEHTPSYSLPLKPVDTDTFQLGRMLMRFKRDKSGKIVALDYTNPVIHNIPFTRLNNPDSHP